MNIPDNEARITSNHEVEPGSKVFVEFYGFAHNHLNLQAVPEIIQGFEDHLSKARGKTVLFYEHAEGTMTGAKIVEENFRRSGFRGYLLSGVVLPRLAARSAELIDAALQADELSPTLPANLFQQYRIAQGFDQLQEKYGFSFKQEVHSDEILKRVRSLHKDCSAKEIAMNSAWQEGRYDDFVNASNAYSQLARARDGHRDRETADLIAKVMRKQLAEPEGGSVFVLMGTDHHSLIDPLASKFKTGVEFKKSGRRSAELNPQQFWFVTVIISELSNRYFSSGREGFLALMKNFSTIFEETEMFVKNLTEDQIRQFCGKTNILPEIKEMGLDIRI